jgi:hypothetical protein
MESLDFLDFSFKLERGLSNVRASYFNTACLDIFSVFVYAIIFRSSPFYFWLSMLVRPLRGIIGFYLSMTIPRTDELIDRIDFNELKTKQPEGLTLIYFDIRPSFKSQTTSILSKHILEYDVVAKYYVLLSLACTLVDIIGWITFCAQTIQGQGAFTDKYVAW